MKLYGVIIFTCLLVHVCFGYRIQVEEKNNGGLFDDFFRTVRSIIEDDPTFDFGRNNSLTLKTSDEASLKKKLSKNDVNSTSGFIREERELVTSNADTSADIACTVKSDCNQTSYCDKLSYTCLPCISESEHCSSDQECCSGHFCNLEKKTCDKKKGQSGDRCESADDCLRDHCCTLNDNGDGVCRPYLKEGEDCSADNLTPFFFLPSASLDEARSGLPSKCPCTPGLHCRKRESFFFFESEKCSNRVTSSNRRHRIRLNLRKPAFRFHKESEIPIDLPDEEFEDGGITKTFTQTHTSGPITIHRVYKVFRFPMSQRKSFIKHHHKRRHFFLPDLLRHSLPVEDKITESFPKYFGQQSNKTLTQSNDAVRKSNVKTTVPIHAGNDTDEGNTSDFLRENGFNFFDSIFKNVMQGIVKSLNYQA